MRRIIAVLGGVVAIAALAPAAGAQEAAAGYLAQHVAAPGPAVEIKVGTGYTQGFGMMATGRSIPDVAGAGVGVSAEVDYRLSPLWSLGGEAQLQALAAEQSQSARGFATNFGATYHFAPRVRGDPWLRFAAGYRFVWENNPTGTSGVSVVRHGFEPLAAKIGYDVRVSEDIALGPVVGADLNVFLWEDPSNGSARALPAAEVGTFVYAGLQGRFDIGGVRTEPTEAKGVTASQPGSPIAPPEPPAPAVETRRVSPSLDVSAQLLRDCRMNLDAVDKAPKFEFDKSDLLPGDTDVLAQIAACFTTGPMKGARLRLVGRADPRGTIEYNDSLGTRRAHEVARFLESRGIDVGQIASGSRGKRDAQGHDEATWAVDRRVDVLEAE